MNEQNQAVVLSNIKELYDGISPTSSSVHRSVDIVIDKGRIKAVRPHDPSNCNDRHSKAIDCSQYAVTPGLIDCHGHITLQGFSNSALEAMNSQSAMLYIERILYATLVYGGVTTMRDVGGATHFMQRMVDERLVIGPRLKIAICMLSPTGGHADFRGYDRDPSDISSFWMPMAPGRPSSIVDGPWECRKRVREIAACGADLIKICTSGGIASPSDKLEHRSFTREELEAICDEAESKGLPVVAHAHSRGGIELAIDHGVYDIQHISFMDEDLAEKAYKKGCTVTPTSWIINKLMEIEELSTFVKEKVQKAAEAHAKAVRLVANGGLKILMGTDPVLPGMHGKNFMELVYLVEDGVEPLVAWYGGTGLAAKEIRQDDTGTIAPNKRADLLICKPGVLEKPDLMAECAIVEVIKDGEGYRGHFDGIPQRTFTSSAREIVERQL